MYRPIQNRQWDMQRSRRRTILDPRPELAKEAGGWAAGTTEAVRHAGNLIVSVEAVNPGKSCSNLFEILPRPAGGNNAIDLCQVRTGGPRSDEKDLPCHGTSPTFRLRPETR